MVSHCHFSIHSYTHPVHLPCEILILKINKNSSEQTEAKVTMIWGLIVACGYQLLNVNDNSKGQLLTLGRYLQTISNQSDGWGDGLLGAIGLKKDGFSKK